MGRFLNPSNDAFQVALNSEIYIDKTGLIEYTNSVLNTKQALICNSRPRRFGKSTTADMLVAYYSRGCDSEEMFAGRTISQNKHFKKHLNKYNFMPIREFPTGRGFVDYVFIPKPEYVREMPALLVELKWNKNVNTAIQQIKDKHYTQALEHYTGDIFLVGINYNKKSKLYECLIEKFIK